MPSERGDDRLIEKRARQDADKRVAARFVAVNPPEARDLGDCAVSASVLPVADMADEPAGRLPRHPATVLAAASNGNAPPNLRE